MKQTDRKKNNGPNMGWSLIMAGALFIVSAFTESSQAFSSQWVLIGIGLMIIACGITSLTGWDVRKGDTEDSADKDRVLENYSAAEQWGSFEIKIPKKAPVIKITTEEILDLIDRVQQTKQAAASNEFMDDLAESRMIVSLLGSGIVNNTKSRPFLLRIQAVLKDYLEYADQPFQTYETMDEIRRAEQEYAEICSDMKVKKAPETEAARKA